MILPQFPGEQSADGEFLRQDDVFRDWVTADQRSKYPAAKGRYHLYVSWACPWAHRTIIVRKLKQLEDSIGMTVVDPIRDEKGWRFRKGSGHSTDPVNGFAYLSEAYIKTHPTYQGRVTVPVLWDTQTCKIVSNSDEDIMRMFNREFEEFTETRLDLYPATLADEIDEMNTRLYEGINDGVYRAGFATSQKAYEQRVQQLFHALDWVEERLSYNRYLLGPMPMESDWRLFVTLIRFDAVYFSHFKCNIRRIVDYPNLFGYLKDLYQIPGIADTVNFEHIKRHYYVTHDTINPTRIVPLGPVQDFTSSHGRA